MKKIKVLHKILLVFNVITTIGVTSTVVPYYDIFVDGSAFRMAYESEINYWISTITQLIMVAGLFFIQRSLYIMYTKEYFNPTAIKNLNTGGIIIIGLALLSFGLYFTYDNSHAKFHTITTSIYEIFIGFTCLIISDILSKGNEIKEDSDLTI